MNLELDYLECIKNIEELGCGSLYGLENMRYELHRKILEKHGLSDFYERSKYIMSNLDKAIDFKLPLDRCESLKPYARELERLLSCQEGQYFITGKTYFMRTKCEVIRDDSKD